MVMVHQMTPTPVQTLTIHFKKITTWMVWVTLVTLVHWFQTLQIVACTKDVDDDGIENDVDVCPWLHDPNQEDADGDGLGDACDCQPSDADPSAVCPYTIYDIQNPMHPIIQTQGHR